MFGDRYSGAQDRLMDSDLSKDSSSVRSVGDQCGHGSHSDTLRAGPDE